LDIKEIVRIGWDIREALEQVKRSTDMLVVG